MGLFTKHTEPAHKPKLTRKQQQEEWLNINARRIQMGGRELDRCQGEWELSAYISLETGVDVSLVKRWFNEEDFGKRLEAFAVEANLPYPVQPILDDETPLLSVTYRNKRDDEHRIELARFHAEMEKKRHQEKLAAEAKVRLHHEIDRTRWETETLEREKIAYDLGRRAGEAERCELHAKVRSAEVDRDIWRERALKAEKTNPQNSVP